MVYSLFLESIPTFSFLSIDMEQKSFWHWQRREDGKVFHPAVMGPGWTTSIEERTTLSAILRAPARTILICLSQPVASRLLSQCSWSISGKHICLTWVGWSILNSLDFGPFCSSPSWHECCQCQGKQTQGSGNYLHSRNLPPSAYLLQHLPIKTPVNQSVWIIDESQLTWLQIELMLRITNCDCVFSPDDNFFSPIYTWHSQGFTFGLAS